MADCPLVYTSPDAPGKRDVLGTVLLSVLAGHKRYAHITALRADTVLRELIGMTKVMSEDAIRRAMAAIEEDKGIAWLQSHLDSCIAPLWASLGSWMPEIKGDRQLWEHSALVTSLDGEILTLGQLYRDRADCENAFDELKNQWGWGGFTPRDLTRCRLTARNVALIYNWWNLFVRLAEPGQHLEAITSWPLLLTSIGALVKHAQITLRVANSHGRAGWAAAALAGIALFLGRLTNTAEQLTPLERWRRILSHALRHFLKVACDGRRRG